MVVVVVGRSDFTGAISFKTTLVVLGDLSISGADSELVRVGESVKNNKVKEVVVASFHRVLLKFHRMFLKGFSFDRQ